MRPFISVVIPTFKRNEQLVDLLNSIACSNYPQHQIEVIVIDNGGEFDGSEVNNLDLDVRVVKPGKNLWSNGARRRGTERARGEYVLHIDDDNILEKDCIHELVKAMDADSGIGVAGPLMLDGSTDTIWCAGSCFDSWGRPVYLHKAKQYTAISNDQIRGIDFFPNACMVRRNVLERVPFDDVNFPHNWAESDFGLRVMSEGYEQVCIPSALERHFGGYDGPLTRIGPDKTYDQAKSRIIFRKRHMWKPGQFLKFWIVNFPASTLFYGWAILRSPVKKLSTASSYIRGTLDGIKQPLLKIPPAAIAEIKK
jgi:GT2 family glycosyltransferase